MMTVVFFNVFYSVLIAKKLEILEVSRELKKHGDGIRQDPFVLKISLP